MNNTQHLMIDIEAAGKSTSAALLSIGAVFFDPATGKLGEQFYRPIKLASAQYHGGTIDASTVEWWMKQSEEARSVFNAENRVSLKDALNSLAAFIKTMAGDADVHVWGNGPAYDNAILANAFNATWIKQPWSFSKDTCVRTMVMLGRQLGIDPKYDLPMEGEHHNALDDAIHQARYVSVIWQTLFADSEDNIKRKELIKLLSNISEGLVVQMQSAWIEWQHGKGAEDAMKWIERDLWQTGNLPHPSTSADDYFQQNHPHCKDKTNGKNLISDEHKRLLKIAVEKIDDLFSDPDTKTIATGNSA